MKRDPRLSVIEKRLSNVKKIIAVSGGKGGIGKSTVSSLLALALSKRDYSVGLLDLDLSSPSDHVILGIKDATPVEKEGIVPPVIDGIQFMSIVFYARDKPIPLRGSEISDAIKEILCITRWKDLDFLIVDMPPGIGDELFDVIELFQRAEFLLLSTSSKVVFETVRRLIHLLKEMKIPITGIAENMKRRENPFIKDVCNRYKLPFLGEIWFDEKFEDAIGDTKKIVETKFFKDVENVVNALLERGW